MVCHSSRQCRGAVVGSVGCHGSRQCRGVTDNAFVKPL